jgi:hypothetical protein
MHAYDAAGWEPVRRRGGRLGRPGRAAVLAVSINLSRILEYPGLPGRAGEAIGLLVGVLVVSTLVLVPGQSRTALGAELLAAGLLAWSVQVGIHTQAVRRRVGPAAGSTGWFPG